ncbi:LytR family transcriptional regulator, partial [Candidatus Bipolaricaulota bacterium]|nr:LytR family transcriptional regulator [Candidatus Bipolaricaulota bacterium]
MRTRYWKAVLATVLATVLVVGVAIPTLAQTVIDIAAVPGVTAPVLGASPVAAITETAQYTGAVVWAPTDDPF